MERKNAWNTYDENTATTIQKVARLDVAVNDAFRMHLADGLKQIPHVLLHLHVTHIPIPHVLEGAGSDEQGEVVVLDHGEN